MHTLKNIIIILIIIIIITISILIIYPKYTYIEHAVNFTVGGTEDDIFDKMWRGGDITLLPDVSVTFSSNTLLPFACAIPETYTGTVIPPSIIPSFDIDAPWGTRYSYVQPATPDAPTVNVPNHFDISNPTAAPRSYSSLAAWNPLTNKKSGQWLMGASYTPDCTCLDATEGTADLPSWTTPDVCIPRTCTPGYEIQGICVPALLGPCTKHSKRVCDTDGIWPDLGCVGGGCIERGPIDLCATRTASVWIDEVCVGGGCLSHAGLQHTFAAVPGIKPVCTVWDTLHLELKGASPNFVIPRVQISNMESIEQKLLNDPVVKAAKDGYDTLASEIQTHINNADTALKATLKPICDLINKVVNKLNMLNNLGSSTIDKNNNEVAELMTIFEQQITATTTLLENFRIKLSRSLATNIECLNDIFKNITIIIETFFEKDLPKFYEEGYTLKTKLYNIKNRTANFFSKLGSVIVCINILSICIKEGLYVYTLKIIYYLFNTLLVDTWKLLQYTIKYNLIDLLSTHPSLNKLIAHETYNNSIYTIVLRSIQMIRGSIDSSEFLLDSGINIVGWVNVSISMFEYITAFGKDTSTTAPPQTTPPNTNHLILAGGLCTITNEEKIHLAEECEEFIDDIRNGLKNIIEHLNPFKGINTFNDHTELSQLKSKNKTFQEILQKMKTTFYGSDEKSLKSLIQVLCLNFMNCEHTDNLNDYYCKLDFNSTLKETVNDIKKTLNDSQNSMYLKLYSFFIDISKPYGWSYEENKQDIEDKINLYST